MNKKILWKTFGGVHFHNQAISVYSILVYPFPTISFNFYYLLTVSEYILSNIYSHSLKSCCKQDFSKPYHCKYTMREIWVTWKGG